MSFTNFSTGDSQFGESQIVDTSEIISVPTASETLPSIPVEESNTISLNDQKTDQFLYVGQFFGNFSLHVLSF